MKIKSSYLFAAGIAVVVALYFVIGSIISPARPKAAQTPAAGEAKREITVQVRDITPVSREFAVVLRGRTEAARTVVVRSETAGVVAATPAVEGGYVAKGAVLCRLAVDARQATLDQARANLRSQQLSQQAAVELAKKGYRSQTQLLQAQASLDAATAMVRQAEISLDQVNIRAPFAGVFDSRDAETGAYLAPGQPCGTVIELDPILIVGDVPETEASALVIGAPATARLTSGETVAGQVRYVAREAHPQTRTYRVEVIARNPKLAIRSGLSAELRVRSGVGPAHNVPVSALVLDAAGRQGVRSVGPDGKVAFTPITVLEETADGVWVRGLSGPVRLIVVGQSYVGEGQKVRVAVAR